MAKQTKRKKQSKQELIKFLEEKGTQFSQELKNKATKWELMFKDILKELAIPDLKIKEFVRFKIGE